MPIYAKVILSAAFVFMILNYLDWMIYLMRSAPKQSYFSIYSWLLAFVFAVGFLAQYGQW